MATSKLKSRRKSPERARFARSVNIEQDIRIDGALDGYVVTAGVRRCLQRIGQARTDANATRVWTLTGPYGTGKSAFALFVAHLFGAGGNTASTQAKKLLQARDPALAMEVASGRSVKPLLPVVVTGAREPLGVTLLRGLRGAADEIAGRKASSLTKQFAEQLADASAGKTITSTAIKKGFRSLLDVTSSSEECDGIFLVVDELGKLLEHAAADPSSSDIFVLQDLAEFAARSNETFLFLTILHQDFAGYASHLSSQDRVEWDKIRGRFEDIAFEEPADEVLRLVAMARDAKDELPKTKKPFKDLCSAAWSLELAPVGVSEKEFLSLLEDCWPLHPLVATMLGHLFRKIAQNERSVFSFLGSNEPFSLNAHLSNGSARTVYSVDKLYDYLTASIGDGLYSRFNGKRWAEVQTVLDRIPDATETQRAVVKVIGLLGAIGQWRRLAATKDVLRLALSPAVPPTEIERALKGLLKSKAIVSRRYNNSFSLWEGSDVDLDEKIADARSKIDRSAELATLASRFADLRPLIATRNSFQTGALRFFEMRFASPKSLSKSIDQGDTGADGSVIVLLPENARDKQEAIAAAKSKRLKSKPNVIVAIPTNVTAIENAVREFSCLEYVKDKTPELAGDETARRELRARMAETQRQIELSLTSITSPEHSRAGTCDWFYAGAKKHLKSKRELTTFLSTICDDIYSKSPHLQNEIINRRDVSSQAAAARRNLIEGMLRHGDEVELGIEGTPPEKSIYLSLLADTGIHRKGSNGWEFGPPQQKGEGSFTDVWNAISEFLKTTEKGARPVDELYSVLASPPYGVLPGPMPILLAASLIANDASVALYEDGTFVPRLDIPVFERLVRGSQRFTLQRWSITGVRAKVFEQLAKMLNRDGKSVDKKDILNVVRPLCRFASDLSDFAKNTKEISPEAQQIRSTLLKARQPDQLLFEDLPAACNAQGFKPRSRASDKELKGYINKLQAGLAELQQCYDKLLSQIQRSFGKAFALTGTLEKKREALSERANSVSNFVADPKLKSFVSRVGETQLEDREWIESVAGVLTLKQPCVWRDEDRARFEVELATVSRLFHHVEAISFDKPKKGRSRKSAKPTNAVRIGITTADSPELERVIRIPADKTKEVDRLQKVVLQALKKAGVNGNVAHAELAAAAMAHVTKKLLD